MTDKELLELAAKAAGISISEHIGARNDYFADDNTGKEWNPLTDDGDTLRLAVKLGFGISIPLANKRTNVVTFNGPMISVIEAHGEPYAATRRAVVRAAAAIGKAQEPKANKVWECNQCGAQQWTGSISEADVHDLGCTCCGGDEWHLAEPKP